MIKQRILITGGAGFIGSNLADRLIGEGHRITIFDNLSRSGCENNVSWLQTKYGENSFKIVKADLANFDTLQEVVDGIDRIYHLAGQVAVTTSVKNPRQDFVDNAQGTLNVLEAARLAGNNPIIIYTSTNKVYGEMESISVVENKTRYAYANLPHGIPENQPLDFHSPYGCSKGAGDQYTRDYARIYGLRTVVVRQSCIYGYRQFGIEDQGWVAWFIIAALKGKPITIYGNGKQVRDILFIDDLLDAYDAIIQNISTTSGKIYNIGGGPQNTMSIWAEFGPILNELMGEPISVKYGDWRPGDQPVYISDIRKIENEINWVPKTSVRTGITKLFNWIKANHNLFDHL